MIGILIIKYHLFIVLIPYKNLNILSLKKLIFFLHNLAIKNTTSL